MMVARNNLKVDYRAVFYIGLLWIPVGFVLERSVFVFLGLVFIVIALLNRRCWGKCNQCSSSSSSGVVLRKLGLFMLLMVILYVIFR